MPEVKRRRSGVRTFYSLAPLLLFLAPGCFNFAACDDPNVLFSPIRTIDFGPEAGVGRSNGFTDPALGIRVNYMPPLSPLGVSAGASKGFPDMGSAYNGFLAARLLLPRSGPVNFYGLAGGTVSRTSYGVDEYEIPGDFETGGGSFRQGLSGGGQTAYGIRLGVGVEGNRADSKWHPFGEVGYDVFLGGADFANQFKLSGGVTYRLGGEAPPE